MDETRKMQAMLLHQSKLAMIKMLCASMIAASEMDEMLAELKNDPSDIRVTLGDDEPDAHGVWVHMAGGSVKNEPNGEPKSFYIALAQEVTLDGIMKLFVRMISEQLLINDL